MRLPNCYWQPHDTPVTPSEPSEEQEPVWLSGCGERRTLPGTPSEHDLRFCPFCGGKLLEILPKPEEHKSILTPEFRNSAIKHWEEWLTNLDDPQPELFANDPNVVQREYSEPMLNAWALELGTTPGNALSTHGADAFITWIHNRSEEARSNKPEELLKYLEGKTKNAKA